MSILAISDTAGSLGREIGRTVAAALGHEFADREIISKAAERFGEGVLELTHATEEKPSIWERFTETQRRYMAYVEAIVLEMAARETVVLVGRASTTILGKIPQALRVRISAPEGIRAQRVHQQQGLTADAALDYVRRSDRERAARVRFLYHVDWDNPFSYDLVINTERLSADEGARLICQALQEKRVEITPHRTADDQGSESGRAGESRAPRESNDQASADLRHLHRRAPRSERKRPHRRGAPSGAGSGGEPSGCHGGAERHRRAPFEP